MASSDYNLGDRLSGDGSRLRVIDIEETLSITVFPVICRKLGSIRRQDRWT